LVGHSENFGVLVLNKFHGVFDMTSHITSRDVTVLYLTGILKPCRPTHGAGDEVAPQGYAHGESWTVFVVTIFTYFCSKKLSGTSQRVI
jgi:hypothetical protein